MNIKKEILLRVRFAFIIILLVSTRNHLKTKELRLKLLVQAENLNP